ncbi:MAG: hypothetical protein C5B58_02965 [Acidobacteria bacterium]|nr:MAG: hypothetical protein C5B58_02965 [Acidobacteriota bacterium]
MFRLVGLFVMLLLSPAFAAGDRPSFGIVHDTKEESGLKFNCSQTAWDEVQCEFSQIIVSKKAKPNELEKKLEEARQQFRASSDNDKQMNKDLCSDFEKSLAFLRGSSSNIKPDTKVAIQKMNAFLRWPRHGEL